MLSAQSSPVEVRRSARRKRTVTAFLERGRVVVAIPAHFSAAQEKEWVQRMIGRIDASRNRRRRSDDQLLARAWELSQQYLNGSAQPVTVAWSQSQERRWGSCTPADGAIRLSSRLQQAPPWVVDYVLMHELAHLLVPGHGPDFWQLVDRYPRTERARGFLSGISFAVGEFADQESE